MKQRMSSADVAAEVASLRQRGIVGMRLANVYDISSKVYVLKFSRSGAAMGTDEGDKVLLLVDSGSRFHTVSAMPEKSDSPSNFSLKLRKHVRTRRLESIDQLGVDRLVRLTFGTGEKTHHLIFEFYAQGNLILTDSKYTVLTLLRSHRDDSKDYAIMSRHIYPIQSVRLRQPVTAKDLEQALSPPGDNSNESSNNSLKLAVSQATHFGPQAAEHCILKAGLDPDRDYIAAPLTADEQAALLQKGIRSWEQWLDSCDTAAPGGAILFNMAKPDEYQEYEPLMADGQLIEQHKGRAMKAFSTFDEAVQEFYAKISSQRAASQQIQREKAVTGKLEAIQRDQNQRLEGLSRDIEQAEFKATLIECNLAVVDAALGAVNDALNGGMDWADLGKLIKDEKKAGNPVAALIESLQLDKHTITLLLTPPPDDDDAGNNKPVRVEVDIGLTAAKNSRSYYDMKRKHTEKQRKTLEANERSLKAAEKKAMEQLIKVKAQQGQAQAAGAIAGRKIHWFERFHWFISSENYLIVAGRDAQQNEQLVKRYMVKGDAYVHADLHGAASVVVKNNNADNPIPPLTLFEAGQACICRSAAWNAKVVASAWWVHPDQVSKTAPTGEYLTTGSFIIRGRKNYLPPQPLVMGLGFLFRLEESSIAAHFGERAPRTMLGDDAGDSSSGARQQSTSTTKLSSATQAMIQNLSIDEATDTPKDAYEAFLESSFDHQAQYQRYGLSLQDEQPEDDSNVGSGSIADALLKSHQSSSSAGGDNSTKGAGRRHLSAKERKLQKKGDITVAGQDSGFDSKGKKVKAAQQQVKQQQQNQPVRGKNLKGKKAKQKYQDQDDEDRELAMQMLKSAGQKKDRKQRKSERKEKMAARKAAQSGLTQRELTEEEIARLTAKPTVDDDGDAYDGSSSSNSSSSDDGQHEDQPAPADADVVNQKEEAKDEPPATTDTNAEDAQSEAALSVSDVEMDDDDDDAGNNGTEEQDIAALLAEENIIMLGEEDQRKVTILDALTGCPKPEDTLLYALPVCAPYSVLANYKFRVKLVPGPLKKGRAGKQAVEMLSREAAASSREKDLIKAVPEQELINAVIGGVRLQVAGLQKLQKKQRGQKKKK